MSSLAVVIGDDGSGPTISRWDAALGPQPTAEQLAAVTQEQVDRAKLVPGVDTSTVAGAKQLITAIRYQKESAGIYVGEQLVTTFRDEMPIWQGFLLDIALRPGVTTSFEYKPRGGTNTTLTVAQVQRCYECFAWYVIACFATERYLIGLLETSTVQEVLALLDSGSVWPQTTFEWVAP